MSALRESGRVEKFRKRAPNLVDLSAAFQILAAIKHGLDFDIKSSQRRRVAFLPEFDRGCPLVKLRQQSGLDLFQIRPNPLFAGDLAHELGDGGALTASTGVKRVPQLVVEVKLSPAHDV